MPGSNSRPNVSEGYEVPTELPGSTGYTGNKDRGYVFKVLFSAKMLEVTNLVSLKCQKVYYMGSGAHVSLILLQHFVFTTRQKGVSGKIPFNGRCYRYPCQTVGYIYDGPRLQAILDRWPSPNRNLLAALYRVFYACSGAWRILGECPV